MSTPTLSICITTRNRAESLAKTLENIIREIDDSSCVNVIVVDGASTDRTAQVVQKLGESNKTIKYFREEENSGVDGDFDKAVRYADGIYCWLFSDDDMLLPGAISVVLHAIRSSPDALIVDAEVRSDDLSELLAPYRLTRRERRLYDSTQTDEFLLDCAAHLTFIGAVIVRREIWMKRERNAYMGSEFIHVGVLFQYPPLDSVLVIPEPLVSIRYGVGNWSARSFDVWMYKWPRLIWSFTHVDASSRAHVTPEFPWRNVSGLMLARAKGWYSWVEFKAYLWPRSPNKLWTIGPAIVAAVPGSLFCCVAILALKVFRPDSRGGMFDLKRSRYAKFWRPASKKDAR